MSELWQIGYAFFGSLGFAILFNIRGSKLFWAAFGGAIDWSIYLLAGLLVTEDGWRYFLAALVLGFYSDLMARIKRVPTTVFLVVGFIPLIPGAGLYTTMHDAIARQWDLFFTSCVSTVMTAVSICAGIVVSMMIITLINRVKEVPFFNWRKQEKKAGNSPSDKLR